MCSLFDLRSGYPFHHQGTFRVRVHEQCRLNFRRTFPWLRKLYIKVDANKVDMAKFFHALHFQDPLVARSIFANGKVDDCIGNPAMLWTRNAFPITKQLPGRIRELKSQSRVIVSSNACEGKCVIDELAHGVKLLI